MSPGAHYQLDDVGGTIFQMHKLCYLSELEPTTAMWWMGAQEEREHFRSETSFLKIEGHPSLVVMQNIFRVLFRTEQGFLHITVQTAESPETWKKYEDLAVLPRGAVIRASYREDVPESCCPSGDARFRFFSAIPSPPDRRSALRES